MSASISCSLSTHAAPGQGRTTLASVSSHCLHSFLTSSLLLDCFQFLTGQCLSCILLLHIPVSSPCSRSQAHQEVPVVQWPCQSCAAWAKCYCPLRCAACLMPLLRNPAGVTDVGHLRLASCGASLLPKLLAVPGCFSSSVVLLCLFPESQFRMSQVCAFLGKAPVWS